MQKICTKYAKICNEICKNMQKYANKICKNMQNICKNIRVYVFAYGAYTMQFEVSFQSMPRVFKSLKALKAQPT